MQMRLLDVKLLVVKTFKKTDNMRVISILSKFRLPKFKKEIKSHQKRTYTHEFTTARRRFIDCLAVKSELIKRVYGYELNLLKPTHFLNQY